MRVEQPGCHLQPGPARVHWGRMSSFHLLRLQAERSPRRELSSAKVGRWRKRSLAELRWRGVCLPDNAVCVMGERAETVQVSFRRKKPVTVWGGEWETVDDRRVSCWVVARDNRYASWLNYLTLGSPKEPNYDSVPEQAPWHYSLLTGI